MEKIKYRTVISETLNNHRSCNCINCYYGIYGMFVRRTKKKKISTNVQPSYREVLSGNKL